MMDLGQVTQWRNLISKVGATFCIIALLAMVDGLLVHFREPSSLVKVLPGTNIALNGELSDEATGIQDLMYVSSSNQLRVTFEAIHKGYFLGGDMWRGRLHADPHISSGEYWLTVMAKGGKSDRAAPAFRIRVFPDASSIQKSSSSLIRRFLGLAPFKVAASCLPGILLAFGIVYYLSGKRDILLAQEGQAEIYRVLRREGGYEIRFGLGAAQGLGPGTKVSIFNEAGQMVGIAAIEASGQTDSFAVVTADQEIKAGYLVSLQV